MEGYYWRIVDPAAGRVAMVLCGVCAAPDGRWAVVALARHPEYNLKPGAKVLDVGCGTGKQLAANRSRFPRTRLLGVDPEMAAIARGHGLAVEVGGFEQWDPAGRSFDLLIAAQAWHWIDPAVAPAKAAGLLRPNGSAVLFWNHEDDLDPKVREVLDEVYRRYAPELLEIAAQDRSRREAQPYVADLRTSGAFGEIEVKEYVRSRTYSAEDWVGTVQTHSDHLQLDLSRRAQVGAALHAAIEECLGGAITTSGGTYSIWARP